MTAMVSSVALVARDAIQRPRSRASASPATKLVQCGNASPSPNDQARMSAISTPESFSTPPPPRELAAPRATAELSFGAG